MTIETIWQEATKSIIPREGDYVSVSATNIEAFSKALLAKFVQELCVAKNDCNDNEFNELIDVATAQLFQKWSSRLHEG